MLLYWRQFKINGDLLSTMNFSMTMRDMDRRWDTQSGNLLLESCINL